MKIAHQRTCYSLVQILSGERVLAISICAANSEKLQSTYPYWGSQSYLYRLATRCSATVSIASLLGCQSNPPPAPVPAPVVRKVVEQQIDYTKRPRVVDGEGGARIIFPAGILFEFNSSTLANSALTHFDDCQFIYERARGRIIVEGHTDARGAAAANQTLSGARARSVQAELVSRKIAPSRIDIRAMGATRPSVAQASSEEDHALNRRAEMVLAGETVASLGAEHGCGKPPEKTVIEAPLSASPPAPKPKSIFDRVTDTVQDALKK